MPEPAILRPDSKGRIGLQRLTQQLERRFNGRSISGYSASLTEDGEILLRPRVEVDAEAAATLILSDADRDAFLEALDNPPPLDKKLQKAMKRHKSVVVRE